MYFIRNNMKKYFIPGLVLLLFLGCATVYKNPAFKSIYQNHKIVAIVPFDVSISMKKLSDGMTYKMLKEMEKDEAYVIQSEIYAYFLKRQSKNKYTVKFQDVDKTNSRLTRAGINFDNIRNYTKKEIAKILNVDAVLSGTVHRTKPMSSGAAIALQVLTRIRGTTNKVETGVTIHNGADGELLWKYNHSVAGSLGSSSQRLVKSLMNDVTKKFPYKRD